MERKENMSFVVILMIVIAVIFLYTVLSGDIKDW